MFTTELEIVNFKTLEFFHVV